MRSTCVLATGALLATGLMAQDVKTEDQKTLYAIGVTVAQQLKVFELTPAELELVVKGLKDAASGKQMGVDLEGSGPRIQQLAAARRKALSDKHAAAGAAFLEKATAEKGAVKTPSGLVYLSLKEGDGPSPGAKDKVKVHYRGTLIDGKEFDSSYKRGEPAEFGLDQVIKAWTEGLQRMKVGGKARLVCPPALAYGERGSGSSIPPSATLVFEVELLGIQK